MRAIVLLLGLGLPVAASGQTVADSAAPRYNLAPWWMDAPVTPSIGSAETRLMANRAAIQASFQVVDESSAEATRLAAEKVANLGAQLRAFGADKARVETTFSMEPIYEQYRDKAGTLNDNERADKIERYRVSVDVAIEVRDLSVLEQIYSTVLAARPTRTRQVTFSLVADNAATTALLRSAAADARDRATRAVRATGGELGPVKLIDSSGQACSAANLLAGATPDEEASVMSSVSRKRAATVTVDNLADTVVVGARASRAAPELQPEDMRLPLQPPLVSRSTQACVVFGLATVQAAASPASPRFGRAHWWMDQPIVASTGLVEAEVLANHARFSATFQVVDRTAPDATKAAADKVRALGQVLSAYDPSKVTIQTTFDTRPIYQQYRDKEGNLVDNERADKIDAYEANAELSVEIRDVALVERIYASVLAARPSATSEVDFNVEADDSTMTQLYERAVTDAARRARLSVESTGSKLGPIKLIDPTDRACQADILVAGAPRNWSSLIAYDLGTFPDGDLSRASQRATPSTSAASPAVPGQLPLQAPLRSLTARACVVYSLAG